MAVVHEGEPVLQVRQQVTEKPFSQAAGLFQCIYTAAGCIRGVHHDLRPGFFKARLAWHSWAEEFKDPGFQWRPTYL